MVNKIVMKLLARTSHVLKEVEHQHQKLGAGFKGHNIILFLKFLQFIGEWMETLSDD